MANFYIVNFLREQIIFILTYSIAFLCFGFDLRNTITGFQDGNIRFPDSTCASQNIDPMNPPDGDAYGCTFQNLTPDGVQQVWMGHASKCSAIHTHLYVTSHRFAFLSI